MIRDSLNICRPFWTSFGFSWRSTIYSGPLSMSHIPCAARLTQVFSDACKTPTTPIQFGIKRRSAVNRFRSRITIADPAAILARIAIIPILSRLNCSFGPILITKLLQVQSCLFQVPCFVFYALLIVLIVLIVLIIVLIYACVM